ncbi:hypothetical protein [Bradyrhizobium sp. WD16]|uniref:hypothetical protein n=1 Tax=Bradyrhizobium sp. WD16 TaxID=1521768 RepID=UPI0020A4BA68|nr:hypothetical protein [Bradyrhizobium sp. WD16]
MGLTPPCGGWGAPCTPSPGGPEIGRRTAAGTYGRLPKASPAPAEVIAAAPEIIVAAALRD